MRIQIGRRPGFCGVADVWFGMSCKHKAFRALRGLLSCVDKKVTKETTPVGPSSMLRMADAQAGGAFPEGTSVCRPETDAHRARRPSGIRPTCLPGLNGVGGQDQVLLLTVQSHTTFRIPLLYCLWLGALETSTEQTFVRGTAANSALSGFSNGHWPTAAESSMMTLCWSSIQYRRSGATRMLGEVQCDWLVSEDG